MVLDQGRIAEFEAPQVLLQDRDSIFFGMAKDAGLADWTGESSSGATNGAKPTGGAANESSA